MTDQQEKVKKDTIANMESMCYYDTDSINAFGDGIDEVLNNPEKYELQNIPQPGFDFKELQRKIDEILDGETNESLSEWLKQHRNENKSK